MSSDGEHLLEVAGGDYIFREGDLGVEMYIVHRGRVEILKRVADGDNAEKRLAVFEQGDFFGELSLLDDQPRSASVRAIEDAILVRINGAMFIQMLRDNPEIAVRMMRKLSRRLRHTDRLLEEAMGGQAAEALGSTRADGIPEPSVAPSPYRLVEPESGLSFELAQEADTLIGRADPVTGIEPAVDLTPIDTQRSSSRRHAKILQRDGRLFLAEEIGSMNGTYVNGVRLETGSPAEIHPGDKLRFGVLELELQQRGG